MFEYDKDSMRAAEILDKYDLSPFLKNCDGIDVYILKESPPTTIEEISEALSELTTYEIAFYLEKRYGMHTEEIAHYYVWWNKYCEKAIKEDF